MGRLTTDKKVDAMSMCELAHNSCYAREGKARYRDYDTDIDAREFAKGLMVGYGHWKIDGLDTDNEIVDDDIFDESITENLMYEPDSTIGLIALFYRNLWAMADLREKLKAYEDIIDDPEKLKIIDELYLERCEEINRLKAELAEYKKLEEEKKLIKLPCNVGDTVYYVDDIRKFVDECTITKVDCRTRNRYHMGISIEMQGKLWHCIGAEIIGEVAFHTQEEADQALERMKGDS